MFEEGLRVICDKVSREESFYETFIAHPKETLVRIQDSIGLENNDLDELLAIFNDEYESKYSARWIAILLFSLIAKKLPKPIPLPPPPPPPIIDALISTVADKIMVK